MLSVQTNSQRRTVLLAVVLCCLFATQLGSAQTVRPVIVDYTGKASGSFDLVNESATPLNVVLQPRSFDVDENGNPSYRALDPSVHLKLSSMSFRIPPQQTYTVFYSATADTQPAWFMIYATFSGFPKREHSGMNLQLELPHVIYISAQKPKFSKQDVKIESARYVRSKKLVLVTVANTGSNLGRLEEVEISCAKKKAAGGGGPLFPQKKRIFDYRWDSDVLPEKVNLKFAQFELETAVTSEE